MTSAAPSRVVTLLFTDVEGSTRQWEADADGMRAALARHDQVLRTAAIVTYAYDQIDEARAELNAVSK